MSKHETAIRAIAERGEYPADFTVAADNIADMMEHMLDFFCACARAQVDPRNERQSRTYFVNSREDNRAIEEIRRTAMEWINDIRQRGEW
jgi:hypothetical protein